MSHHESLVSIHPRVWFQRLLIMALLVLVASCSVAETVSLLDGRCRVPVPDGWRVENTYGDSGVVLRPPDPRAWPVEVAAWPAPEGAEESPAAAADAHEAMLRREHPYARTSVEDFATSDGISGLLVTGEITVRHENTIASVFCVFAYGGRYFVVGTFALPGSEEQAIERSLRPVASQLQINNTASNHNTAGDQKPPQETPETDTPGGRDDAPELPPLTGGDSDAPTVGETVPPITPNYNDTAASPLPERPSAEGLLGMSAEGLRVRAPAEWTIEASGGQWTVHPKGMERSTLGILIWPLKALRADMTPSEIARKAFNHWKPTAEYDLDVRQNGQSEAIISGTGIGPSGPLSVLGNCVVSDDHALLTALYVSPDRSETDWPMLAEMLSSARIEKVAFTEPAYAPETYEWALPGVPEVTFHVPEGWKIRGSLDTGGGINSISVEAVSSGSPRSYVTCMQPVLPLFKGLSQLLIGLGHREGDRYQSAGGRTYTLLSPLEPQQFITHYWNTKSRISLRAPEVVEAHDSSLGRGLITSPDAEGVEMILRGDSSMGPRRHHYIAATGTVRTDDTMTWQAAVIEAAGPSGNDAEALAAARTIIGSAEIETTGTSEQIAARILLRRAKNAVSVFPQLSESPIPGLVSVMSHTSAEGTSEWEPPAAWDDIWRQIAAAHAEDNSAEDLLPELMLFTARGRNTATDSRHEKE
ncbi:MAG: hypothetical protein ACLFWB_02540 [Armatimonadota bacterium]